MIELAVELLWVIAPDGARVEINPAEIVALRPPREHDKRTLGNNVRCILFTADGKFIAAVEDCDVIKRRIVP